MVSAAVKDLVPAVSVMPATVLIVAASMVRILAGAFGVARAVLLGAVSVLSAVLVIVPLTVFAVAVVRAAMSQGRNSGDSESGGEHKYGDAAHTGSLTGEAGGIQLGLPSCC